MARVVVVGTGPAGLSAAEAAASEGHQVTLVGMGHLVGGKACSWRDAQDRVVEHGQHIVAGFYDELGALLKRSGVDMRATSISGRMEFIIWEDRDETAHHLHFTASTPRNLYEGLSYSGMTFGEKLAFGAVFARAAFELAAGVPEHLDDICLTAWCAERGLAASMMATNAFRCTREAQLNWPGEISAYAMLQAIRVMGRDYTTAEARFPAGGMSEIWWEPIVARVQGLGGTVIRLKKLTGIEVEGGRVTALRFATPIPHDPAHPHQGPVPTAEDERWTDFDAVILALPAPCLQEVLPPEAMALPGLAGVPRITTVAPLAMQVWHRASVTEGPRTVVCGLPEPLGFVVDNKPNYPHLRNDSSFGASLHFVGQEAGFEDLDDEGLLERSLAGVRRIPGWEGFDRAGVIDYTVVRSRGPHRRYWNAEPGSLMFKPYTRTPVRGLYLAGDWIRSPLDFPCMENAVRTGRQAVAALHDDLRGVS